MYYCTTKNLCNTYTINRESFAGGKFRWAKVLQLRFTKTIRGKTSAVANWNNFYSRFYGIKTATNARLE